jgi:hypothetical protein
MNTDHTLTKNLKAILDDDDYVPVDKEKFDKVIEDINQRLNDHELLTGELAIFDLTGELAIFDENIFDELFANPEEETVNNNNQSNHTKLRL